LAAASEGRDLKLTPGDQVRDFMDVREVSKMIHGYSLLLMGLAECPHFRTINVGTGQPITLRQFTERVWRDHHGTGKLEFGALPYRAGEVMRYVPSIDLELQMAAMAARERYPRETP
jgi:nucleoside-diphosphate-sugar epimerase